MADNQKGAAYSAQTLPIVRAPCSWARGLMVAILLELTLIIVLAAPGTDDESSVTVTPKKELKDGVIRPNGTIKLRRPAPKHNKPGNWRDGSVVDGQ